METVEIKIAKLEEQNVTIFKKLNAIDDDIKDITRLTIAIEKIATETKSISAKVDSIDDRLDNVENAPADEFKHYKRLIIGNVLTGVVGAVIGAILALILKM